VTDFRDHIVKKALDEAIGAYRPETTSRARNKRIAVIVALALLVAIGFWVLLHYSSPRTTPAAAKGKPISVDLLPARPKP